MTTRDDFTAIGKPVPRYDARDRVTGSARYGADQGRPETLWAKLVRSPHPHARIVNIDSSEALALPGVHAVVTGADLPPKTRWGRRTVDVQVLAQEEALFEGEQVAAVIADDEEIAQRGVDLIEVTYEELPAVTDAVEAMKNDAIIVHPDIMEFQGLVHPLDKPTNAVVTEEWTKGDTEAGFKEADRIIENNYTTPTVHQVYMEPHNCTVQANPDGSVEVWAPVKAPYAARNQVARSIGVDPLKIVFHPVSIGGDFGGKGSPMNIPLGYFLSKAVGGKPVQAVFEYAEEFMAANPRHPSVIKVRTGVKKDGTITAHEVGMVFNSGASAGYKPAGFLLGARGAGGFYRIANVRVTEYMVYTHTVPCGHMRGPGEPQALFALESQIDEVARALSMDPVEFRLKNFAGDGEPLGLGEEYIENRSGETLQAALGASNYNKAKSGISRVKIGCAVAMGERAPGGGQNNAQITMNADGSVSVQTPLFEQGAGGVTVTQQIVAETMGLPAERVRIEVQDTGMFEDDSGIGGSRVTNVGGIAADMAVHEAHQEVFKLAAELQNWPEEQLAIQGDKLIRSDTGESQDWKDLLARVEEPVIGRGTYAERGSNVTGYTAQVAEVSVDTETGEVTLLKLTTAHDTGQIINPVGHQGQVNGGVMMGIGYGLMEEIKTESGHIETLSFADYKIPTMADIPEFETVLLEPSTGVGPYGIKAIGESPNAPTAAAIANAVEDAVGVRIRDLPVTAEKVYAALQALRSSPDKRK